MTESHMTLPVDNLVNPRDFIITRKRKLYKFALFHNSPICFEFNEWVNNPEPNVLEIGAGTGIFSVGLAEMNEDLQYVAVDVKADRLQTGARRANEIALSNVRFLRARADQLLEMLKPNSLESIWVTFPDPRPKKHSAKNRLLHPRFLNIYKELLTKDGSIYFKTDVKNLFEWSLEQLVAEEWVIEELSFDLHESGLADFYKIKTNYETRYMREGLSINFVKATPRSK
jgi:tRNA (guanine-N7-)-methyltransferase